MIFEFTPMSQITKEERRFVDSYFYFLLLNIVSKTPLKSISTRERERVEKERKRERREEEKFMMGISFWFDCFVI